MTATEAMQAEAEGGQSKHARNEATDFLRSRLASGPVERNELKEEADVNGISVLPRQARKKRAKC